MTGPTNPLTGKAIPVNGPGKYDDLVTLVRERAGGSVVLMVVGGNLGDGFAVQATPWVIANLPASLRTMADAIERGEM